MKNNYILGVDGGNTKTDYLLFDIDGNFVDGVRESTVSHEQFKESFSMSKQLINQHVQNLLKRNNLKLNDIKSSCFGLAGIDTVNQKNAMEKVLNEIGFENFVVYNDGFLPIKTSVVSPYGICAINGTGTVICGIDETDFCQVGGFGLTTGDCAGGSYLVREIIKAVYAQLFRNRKETTLTKYTLEYLGINENQKSIFYETASKEIAFKKEVHKSFIQELFKAANAKDEAAMQILHFSGTEMGNGIVGCYKNLNLKKLNLSLAGSVFTNCTCDYYIKCITDVINENSIEYELNIIQEVPAVGAIIWAYENLNISFNKEKIVEEVKKFNKR